MFKAVSNRVAFPEMEKSILAAWERNRTFEKSLARNAGRDRYTFYDGPPFATGLPHYGHLLAGIIKDIVPRYQTMRGINRLEWLDIITGQGDRHPRNYMIQVWPDLTNTMGSVWYYIARRRTRR